MEANAETGAAAPHGQNEPKVSDESVIAVNLSKIKAAQDTANSGNASLRAIMGHAEAKGVNPKAAKTALAIAKKGGDAVDEWIKENAAVTLYLRILRHGVTSAQLELFKSQESSAPLDERALFDGRMAGLMGGADHENPHDLGSAAGQAWLTGLRGGQEERAAVLALEPKEGSELIEGEPPPSDETSFDDEDEE